MYVKCGRCPACQQEKAQKRVNRIHNTVNPDFVCFMVALTYSQHCAPYLLRSDLEKLIDHNVSSIPIYRDCKVRKVRKPSDFNDYNQVYRFESVRQVLDNLDYIDSSFNSSDGLKDLAKEDGKIGICLYSDYQQFAARFRLNLKRHYNYENELFIYACSEYGVKSFRPHFHLLVVGRKADKEKLRNAIYESWPFSNLRRFPKSVQESYRSASYVASYVNSDSRFPKFFKVYKTPKHSYSKGFGTLNSEFDLHKILEKLQRGYLAYTCLKNINGIPTKFDVPIPSYVINRFFPRFKGYTRVSVPEVLSYLLRIRSFDYQLFWSTSRCSNHGELIDVEHKRIEYLVDDEISKVWTTLSNSFRRCRDALPDFGLDFTTYAILHQRVWSAYNSTLLRLQMENDSVPLEEHFDNLEEYVDRDGCDNFFKMAGLDPKKIKYTNPNMFSSVRESTSRKESFFHQHLKHRRVANEIYHQIDGNCEL